MSRIFDCTRLVAADVACLGGDDTLIALKHRGYHNLICLGSAADEFHLGIRGLADLLYLLFRTLAELIGTVARNEFIVGFSECIENLWATACSIVGFKCKHRRLRTRVQKTPPA